MADFRKWVLVLAIVAAFVVPASAQVTPPYTCNVSFVPTTVRAEGLTELVGDILLLCSGGPVGGSITANFSVFFTAPVTSKLAGSSGANALITESLLLLDDCGRNTLSCAVSTPAAPLAGANAFLGERSGPSTLLWNNITIPTGGEGSTRLIRITNVRVNASAVGAGISSPQQISAILSITGTTTVFVNQNVTPVATVVTGLVLDVGNPASFQQCVPATQIVGVNFQEGFPSAFKPIGSGQTDPQVVNFNESGIILTAPTFVGTASTGTRLFVRFAAIPNDVTIKVPGTIASSLGGSAELVGFTPSSTTIPSGISVSGLNTVTMSSGSGFAVYEVKSSVPGAVETFTVPVSIITASGTALTSSTTPPVVGGGLAPTSVVTVPSSSDPIPRFVDVSVANKPLFSVNPCITNLLFPFLTNQAGFDTGVALINTSLDEIGSTNLPFNTPTQSGTCTIYYFGAVAGGGQVPAPQTTASIAPGQMATLLISNDAPGFQGYAIVRCNFQFAHGYAFVSDLGSQKLAHGYLALVIPDRPDGSRKADPFTTAPANSGEQLAR